MGLVADYGPCPCGAEYELQWLSVLDDPVRVDGFPKGHCPNCGADVYKAVVVAHLETLLFSRPAPTPPEPL